MKHTVSSIPNPIGQRLKHEMKKRGITSAELAKRADVKTSFIYDVLSGKSTNPSTVKLARVADGLGISLTQLVEQATGHAPALAALRNDDYVAVPRLLAEVSGTGQPLLSLAQEGQPYCFRHAWIKEHLGIAPGVLRMLTVRGDSMEPNLCHNDVVLVDISKKTPSPPGIFIIFDGAGLTAKRLEYVPDARPVRVRVLSDNPQYSSYEQLLEDASIIGRVVWVAREI